jgi:hypothetical protein
MNIGTYFSHSHKAILEGAEKRFWLFNGIVLTVEVCVLITDEMEDDHEWSVR